MSVMSTNMEIETPLPKAPEGELRLKVFEIRVPWSKGDVDWKAKGAPFKVSYGS